MRKAPTLAAAVLAVLGSACGDANDDPTWPVPEVTHGRHVRLRSDGLEPTCGGTLAYLDTAVEVLSAAIQVPIPEDFDFYWYHGPLEQMCSPGAGACWTGREVVSPMVPHDHEVVHAVAAGLGETHQILREGLAVAYGDDVGHWKETPSYDPDALFEVDDLFAPGLYPSAGHWVRFVLDRHGVEPFQAFWRSTPPAATLAQIEESFAQAYGESWDDALAAYASYPACTGGESRMKLMECSDEPAPWTGDTWSRAMDLDCGLPEVVGPTLGYAWKTTTVDIAASGRYSLEVESTGDYSYVTLARCDAACDGGFAENLPAGEVHARELPAGRYYAKFWHPAYEPGTVELRITPQR